MRRSPEKSGSWLRLAAALGLGGAGVPSLWGGFGPPPMMPFAPISPMPSLPQIQPLQPLPPVPSAPEPAPIAEAAPALAEAEPNVTREGNILRTADGKIHPAPGYEWDDPNSSTNNDVHWTPGDDYKWLGRVRWPHVHASDEERKWHHDPGYKWASNSDDDDYSVQWEAGQAMSSDQPHVVSGEREGTWYYQPGYAKVDADGKPTNGDGDVRWVAGLPYYKDGELRWPHVLSLSREGSWDPEPGYTWDNGTEGDYSVHWNPGMNFLVDHAIRWYHVIADETEGRWKLEPGYVWARLGLDGGPPAGNWAVVPEGDPRSPAEKAKALKAHWADYLKSIEGENDHPNWEEQPSEANLGQKRPWWHFWFW